MLKDLREYVDKEGPKVKSYLIKRLPAHDYIRLVLHCKPLGPMGSELFGLLSSAILIWLLRKDPRLNLTSGAGFTKPP